MGKKRFKSYFLCLILNEFHDSSGTTHLTTQQQQQQVAGKQCRMTKASNKTRTILLLFAPCFLRVSTVGTRKVTSLLRKIPFVSLRASDLNRGRLRLSVVSGIEMGRRVCPARAPSCARGRQPLPQCRTSTQNTFLQSVCLPTTNSSD